MKNLEVERRNLGVSWVLVLTMKAAAGVASKGGHHAAYRLPDAREAQTMKGRWTPMTIMLMPQQKKRGEWEVMTMRIPWKADYLDFR